MLVNCGVGEESSRVPWTIRRSVNPKGNQPWLFNGRTNAKAEAPILWPPDAKRQLIGKDPDAGKDWGQEEKGATEEEMVGCRHWLNAHDFEQTLGDIWGQWRLVCYVYFRGLQRVGHNLATEQQQPGIELSLKLPKQARYVRGRSGLTMSHYFCTVKQTSFTECFPSYLNVNFIPPLSISKPLLPTNHLLLSLAANGI